MGGPHMGGHEKRQWFKNLGGEKTGDTADRSYRKGEGDYHPRRRGKEGGAVIVR